MVNGPRGLVIVQVGRIRSEHRVNLRQVNIEGDSYDGTSFPPTPPGNFHLYGESFPPNSKGNSERSLPPFSDSKLCLDCATSETKSEHNKLNPHNFNSFYRSLTTVISLQCKSPLPNRKPSLRRPSQSDFMKNVSSIISRLPISVPSNPSNCRIISLVVKMSNPSNQSAKRTKAHLDETLTTQQKEKQAKSSSSDRLNMSSLISNIPVIDVEMVEVKDGPHTSCNSLPSESVEESNCIASDNKEWLASVEKSIDETNIHETSEMEFDWEEDDANKTWVEPPFTAIKSSSSPYDGIFPKKISKGEHSSSSPNETEKTPAAQSSPKISHSSHSHVSETQKLREFTNPASFATINDKTASPSNNQIQSSLQNLGIFHYDLKTTILASGYFFLASKRTMDEVNTVGDAVIACIVTKDYPQSVIDEKHKKDILERLDEITRSRNEKLADENKKLKFGRIVSRAGIIVITCLGTDTANFVRLTTERLTQKQGSPDVKCVPLKQVKFMPSFSILFPIPRTDFEGIKAQVKANVGLTTDDWVYLFTLESFNGTGTKCYFIGNQELEELAKKDRYGEIRKSFGLVNKISIRRLPNEYEQGSYSLCAIKQSDNLIISLVTSFKVWSTLKQSKIKEGWLKSSGRKKRTKRRKKLPDSWNKMKHCNTNGRSSPPPMERLKRKRINGIFEFNTLKYLKSFSPEHIFIRNSPQLLDTSLSFCKLYDQTEINNKNKFNPDHKYFLQNKRLSTN